VSQPLPPRLQWITSVYFDSDSFAQYSTRLRRDEGAQLFRVRWCVRHSIEVVRGQMNQTMIRSMVVRTYSIPGL
jgi:SPX domain protein involved in polyphosphate accumulation